MFLHYIIIIYSILSESTLSQQSDTEDLSDTEPTYDHWENSICCLNKLRCCRSEPRIELRALLVKCALSSNSSNGHFDGFKNTNDFNTEGVIQNCRKKLMLTIKLQTPNQKLRNCQYVIVDHVYDTGSNKKARLLTPYVVKLKQEAILEVYALEYYHVVNSYAHEEVYNKNTPNFTGCDVSSQSPTCGKIKFRGTDVPYSQGFCCSCNTLKNAKRQPEPNEFVQSIVRYGDPEFILGGIECPSNLKARDVRSGYENPLKTLRQNDNEAKISQVIYLNPFSIDQPAVQETNSEKGQVYSTGEQVRGGQNCADRYTPPKLNPEEYHESAHCLKFSDVWYTVYSLGKPKLEHSALIQIFEEFDDVNGDVSWNDLTDGKMIRVGYEKTQYLDERRTLSIKYNSIIKSAEESTFAINYKVALLLIPECEQNSNYSQYPEMQRGPSEYLVVHKDQITTKGDHCNVGGVGFEAFAKQPNRCANPRETCLSNQPFHLWKHDRKAEEMGKEGCFFLKNYGTFPENPLRVNSKTGEKFLIMNHAESQPVMIDVEIRSDFNTILKPEGAAKITEIYVDSTRTFRTIITAKVTNTGLVSSLFSVRLGNCPLELPASFNDIETKPALIPPQIQHIFHMELKCQLPLKSFQCSIIVMNANREVAALREVLIQSSDRCLCTWHCQCACVDSSHGLKCKPLTLDQYHAAGFLGSLPVMTTAERYGSGPCVEILIVRIMTSIIFILLLLGTIKGLIGLFFSPVVGTFGLANILDLPKPMKHYFEPELFFHFVVYDEDGWPVHPETRKRVRCVKKSTEMFFNVLFFIIYPANACLSITKRTTKAKVRRNTIIKEKYDDYVAQGKNLIQPTVDKIQTIFQRSKSGNKSTVVPVIDSVEGDGSQTEQLLK